MKQRHIFDLNINESIQKSQLNYFGRRFISDKHRAEALKEIEHKEETIDINRVNQEISQRLKDDHSLKVKYKKESELMHQEEIEGIVYKYDLPMSNTPIKFRHQLMVIDEEIDQTTPVINLFDKLDLDKESSYDQYVIKVNQEYNNEIDMYGDIQKAGNTSLKVLQFGTPIPYEQLEKKQLMVDLRLNFVYNRDIPGAIENVHPNKFMANLRPVEDFRHTPVIPIGEKELSDLKKKQDALNRKGYFLEIKKDTLYYYAITAFIMSVIGYAFYITNEKGLGVGFDMDKHRVGRFQATTGRQGADMIGQRQKFKIPELNK